MDTTGAGTSAGNCEFGRWLNSGMKTTNNIHTVANGSTPSWSVSNRLLGAAGGWLALEFDLDGRDIDVMYEIVGSLDWRTVTFGCTIRPRSGAETSAIS
jgi:hypothetical protein